MQFIDFTTTLGTRQHLEPDAAAGRIYLQPHFVPNNATHICNQMSQRKFILNMFIKHTLTHNVQIFVIIYTNFLFTAVIVVGRRLKVKRLICSAQTVIRGCWLMCAMKKQRAVERMSKGCLKSLILKKPSTN